MHPTCAKRKRMFFFFAKACFLNDLFLSLLKQPIISHTTTLEAAITMDFKDQIQQIVDRIPLVKDKLETEEATKNALIMPLIMALGYDVFNPLEVVPELSCDIGKKKNEKIDYAIMHDGEASILIECKHWAQNLDLHETQLLRYFTVSRAKFGVLTNGIVYRFYTDLEEPNKMDEKPFFEINLLDLRSTQIEELKKFHKSYFDVDNVLNTAEELKYMRELKAEIAAELEDPSVDFVRMLCKRIVSGMFTAKMQEQFTTLVKRAIASYVNDTVSSRLKTAIGVEEAAAKSSASANAVDTSSSSSATDCSNDSELSEEPGSNRDDRIVTTEEEIEGFHIVKAIVRSVLPADRIAPRDTISYFGILADDNNRRPICRLHFNAKQKYLGTFDAEKKETRHPIDSLDDIFEYEDLLRETAKRYL